MKKLLYTLMLGLVVISCDKEMDMTSSEVVSISQEIDATVELTGDALIDLAISLSQAAPKSERGNVVSASKGSDYVAMTLFTADGVTYAAITDESNDDLCLGAQEHIIVFLDNVDSNTMNVEAFDGSIIASVNGDFSALFSGGNNSVSSYNSDFDILASAYFDASNSATF